MMNQYIFVAVFGIISMSGFADAMVRSTYYITSSDTGDLYSEPNPAGTARDLYFEKLNSSTVSKRLLLLYFDGPNLLVPAHPGTCFVVYVSFPFERLLLETDPAKCKKNVRLPAVRILPGLTIKGNFISDSTTRPRSFLAVPKDPEWRKVAFLSMCLIRTFDLKPYNYKLL